MRLSLPPSVIEFTNAAWPELRAAGGLETVSYRVVSWQPFCAPVAAMAWRGEVLVRRAWIAPCLADLGPGNEIALHHLWAISLLAWHEPHHVLEQRARSWGAYVARYLWQWVLAGFWYPRISEEREAYGLQALLSREWAMRHPSAAEDWQQAGR